jgi:hypothetical protein
MTINSVTTLSTMVGWTMIRVASRALLSLAHWVFVALAWVALAFVGGVMLLGWSWKPIRRFAVAIISAAHSIRSRTAASR